MRRYCLKPSVLSVNISLAFLCAPFSGALAADTQSADEAARQAAQEQVDESGKAVTLTTLTVNADRGDGYKSNYVQVGAFRDQTVLDTPSTINVMPRALIESQNATGIYDVIKNSAGVTRSQTNGIFADNLTIRGLDVQNRANYRLNGSLPLNNLIAMPMENKERVEVLKGSSALYYGFTSPGGVVNLVTKRAMKDPNLSFQVTFNQHGQLVGSMDAGARFGDDNQYGLRFNTAGGNLGGYGIDLIEGDRSFYSVAADWRATDRLSFFLDYEKINRSANEQAIIQVPNAVNGVIPIPQLPSPSNYFSAGRWAVTAGNAEHILGKATYALFDRWAASLEIGRAETNRTDRALGIFRFSNLATGQGTLSMSLNEGEKFVNENLRAEVTGLIPMGSVTNEVSFGFMRNDRFQNTAQGNATGNVYTNLQNIYSPVLFQQKAAFVRPAIGYKPQNARDDGIYLFDRIRFNDQWQAVLGVRRSDYENVSEPTPTTRTVYQAKQTSPSASVVYNFRPDTSLYASYIEGMEEGETAVSIGVINPGQVFGPKISKQKELGLKTEAIDGITATIAYFDMDVPTRGYQIPSSSPPLNLFVQEGQSRYRGVEFNVTGELGRQLSIAAGGMLMDASQQTAATPEQVGKIPDSTVERTFNAYLDYRPLWAPGFNFSAGSFYTGRKPLGPMEQVFLPGYTTHMVGARYSTLIPGDHKLTLQLNVENLTNKEYWAGGNSYIAVGLPRTTSFLVRLDWL